jgi:hypothetical protein
MSGIVSMNGQLKPLTWYKKVVERRIVGGTIAIVCSEETRHQNNEWRHRCEY